MKNEEILDNLSVLLAYFRERNSGVKWIRTLEECYKIVQEKTQTQEGKL